MVQHKIYNNQKIAPHFQDCTDRIIVADWSRGMILASGAERLWFESE
jgi:hypothetical protein